MICTALRGLGRQQALYRSTQELTLLLSAIDLPNINSRCRWACDRTNFGQSEDPRSEGGEGQGAHLSTEREGAGAGAARLSPGTKPASTVCTEHMALTKCHSSNVTMQCSCSPPAALARCSFWCATVCTLRLDLSSLVIAGDTLRARGGRGNEVVRKW